MSADENPSTYVEALAEERAMYASSAVHRDRRLAVEAELAASGWVVNQKGRLVKASAQDPPKSPPPRPHKERAVSKPSEKAVNPD